MQADIELIKKITCGALEVEEQNGAIVFHRFTEAQRKVYESNHGFWLKTFADSGIRLEFATDATKFSMRGRVAEASSRTFCFFDICVNGALVRHVGTHSITEEPDFAFEVGLPEGTNRVAVYLPGLSKTMLESLEFTGATKVEPVAKKRRILCYGDSITQGYDARYPSLAYTNIVADVLDAEAVNKAIGGDRFNPELAELPDAGKFDLVIVGYGTNDWSHETRGFLEERSARFFDALERNYPGVPGCAILPLWRHDCMRVTEVGTFWEGHAIIRAAAEKHKRIKTVNGWELLPHLESCVSDGLHPNDFGFQFMARNLLKQLPVC